MLQSPSILGLVLLHKWHRAVPCLHVLNNPMLV